MSDNIKRKIGQIIRVIDPNVFDCETKLKPRGIKPLGQGWSHLNYLVAINGRKFIFRISTLKGNMYAYGMKRARDRIEKEYNNLKCLDGLGVAPKAYYMDLSCKAIDKPFLIIDYLEGKKIKHHMCKNDIVDLANALAKLHNLKKAQCIENSNFNEVFTKWDARRVKRITEHGQYTIFTNESFRNELLKAYEKAKRLKFKHIAYSIIHGDAGGENIMRMADGIGLIDWEGVALAPPQYDIAMVIDKSGLRGGKLSLFLNTYKANSKKKNSLIQLNQYLMQRCMHRLCLTLVETFKYKLGEDDAIEYFSPEYYIRDAHYEFNRCKELGMFPRNSKLVIKMGIAKGKKSKSASKSSG